MNIHTSSPQPNAARSIGHLALHYGSAEDGPLAARLMGLLGFTQTQMLPLPDGDFYRFVIDSAHHARGDGIVYLSALPQPQLHLIATIRDLLKVGTDHEHDTVREMRAMLASDPEASFHLGFLVQSLEELESRILKLQELADTDPDFAGRIAICMNRPRPGDAQIDARLDASPLFGSVTRYAYGRNGVQVFVETDLFKGGQLGEAMTLEFDYIFPGHDNHILSVVEM